MRMNDFTTRFSFSFYFFHTFVKINQFYCLTYTTFSSSVIPILSTTIVINGITTTVSAATATTTTTTITYNNSVVNSVTISNPTLIY